VRWTGPPRDAVRVRSVGTENKENKKCQNLNIKTNYPDTRDD